MEQSALDKEAAAETKDASENSRAALILGQLLFARQLSRFVHLLNFLHIQERFMQIFE